MSPRVALAFLLLVSPAVLAGTLPPDEVVLQLRLARIAGETGDREQQREILESVAIRYPDETPAVLALMEFHRSLPSASEEARRARSTLRRLLLRPGAEAHAGLLQRFAADPDATDEDLNLIREMLAARASGGERDAGALRLLGGLQEYFGQTEEARSTFGRVLELEPDPTVAGRCISLDMDLLRWESALNLLRSARTESGDFLWRFTAIRIYSAMGLVEELDAELDALLRQRTGVPAFALDSVVAAGFQLYDDGREDRAERLFRHLSASFPGQVELQEIVAVLFAGDEEKATRSAEIDRLWKGIENPIDLVNEGAARLTAGDPAGALDLLRRATDLLPDSDLAWFNRGLAAAALQRWEEAERAFGSAAEADPTFARAFVQRGLARLRLGKIGEAAADARRALEIEPELKQPWYVLSLCERSRGNPARADEYMRRSREP